MPGASRRADLQEALEYLEAAHEFQAAAEASAAAGRWRAAGLDAIHAAIAAADAVCVFEVGERSSSSSHDDASGLLARSGAPGAREKAEQLTAVLELKSQVAYESGLVKRSSAEVLLKRSRRLLDWAHELLKS